MLTWLERLPAPVRLLTYVLLAAIVVIVLALGVEKMGGFDEGLQLGHFHLNIGTASTGVPGSSQSTGSGEPQPPGSRGVDQGHHRGHGQRGQADQEHEDQQHGDQGHGDQGD